MRTAASTYVQISRDELEDWLSTLGSVLSEKWYRLSGKAGVYMLPLSPTVAVKLGSTIGTQDDAMGRGEASMQLALVSRVVELRGMPMVLNKKAQGQSHFARTLNWKKNWKDGIERMKDAYVKAAGFYDALATIQDREAYKADLLARIQSVPTWRNHNILSDFYTRVEQGGILTEKQMALLKKLTSGPAAQPAPDAFPLSAAILPALRTMYVAARDAGDTSAVQFLTVIGKAVKDGLPVSTPDAARLNKLMKDYGFHP